MLARSSSGRRIGTTAQAICAEHEDHPIAHVTGAVVVVMVVLRRWSRSRDILWVWIMVDGEFSDAVVPDEVSEAEGTTTPPGASATAERSGPWSGPEFFARAARRYLDELDAQSLTGRIDDALAHLDPSDESTTDAVAAGHSLLAAEGDEW